MYAASPTGRKSQTEPTCRLVQLSSGKKKARPATRPSPAPAQQPRRCVASASSATPKGAAHHRS